MSLKKIEDYLKKATDEKLLNYEPERAINYFIKAKEYAEKNNISEISTLCAYRIALLKMRICKDNKKEIDEIISLLSESSRNEKLRTYSLIYKCACIIKKQIIKNKIVFLKKELNKYFSDLNNLTEIDLIAEKDIIFDNLQTIRFNIVEIMNFISGLEYNLKGRGINRCHENFNGYRIITNNWISDILYERDYCISLIKRYKAKIYVEYSKKDNKSKIYSKNKEQKSKRAILPILLLICLLRKKIENESDLEKDFFKLTRSEKCGSKKEYYRKAKHRLLGIISELLEIDKSKFKTGEKIDIFKIKKKIKFVMAVNFLK